ncbi:MAG: AAA family ATPase [Thermoguttaceae bacterium]
MPPHLAGRQEEIAEFRKLLSQETILENMVLTGLRGVGKTVLLETLRPLAIHEGWGWVGTDLSESTSISEDRMALRVMTDLAVVTSTIEVSSREVSTMGFRADHTLVTEKLTFDTMVQLYNGTPGLVADKLKAVLELVWQCWQRRGKRGLIFAYDESQTLSDHASKDEYPLSLLLDVFQSIQRKGIPFMLVLVGLPTLFPKLVEARTFAERMFRVVFLDRLNESDSRDAILKPIEDSRCQVALKDSSVQKIIRNSGGYPYFIQFICKECYDVFLQKIDTSEEASVPIKEIIRKLDSDFFAGRWARATDRQRELLTVIAGLDNCENEFTVQELAEKSKQVLQKPFSPSHVNQMLVALSNAGLIYKNRHGKYSFAVPLLGQFISRQQQ